MEVKNVFNSWRKSLIRILSSCLHPCTYRTTSVRKVWILLQSFWLAPSCHGSVNYLWFIQPRLGPFLSFWVKSGSFIIYIVVSTGHCIIVRILEMGYLSDGCVIYYNYNHNYNNRSFVYRVCCCEFKLFLKNNLCQWNKFDSNDYARLCLHRIIVIHFSIPHSVWNNNDSSASYNVQWL